MANTDFGILLKTLLDKSGINSELEQVQKIVNKYSIDIMPELKTASLKNQMKAISQEIANDFNKAFGTNLTGNDVFKAYENQAKQARLETKQLYDDIVKTGKQLNTLQTNQVKLDLNINSKEWDELSRQITEVQSKYDSLMNDFWSKDQKTLSMFNVADLQNLQEMDNKLSQTKAKMQDTSAQNQAKQAYNEIFQTLKQLNALQIQQAKLDPIDDLNQWKVLDGEIQSVSEKYEKLLSAFWSTPDIDKHFNMGDLAKLDTEIQKTAQSIEELNAKKLDKLSNEASKIQYSLDVGDYDAQIETVKSGFVSLSGDANEAETHVKGLRDALKSMHDATDDNSRLAAEKSYQLELEKTHNQLTIARAKAKDYVDVLKVNKLRNDIQDWLKKNTSATKEAQDAMQSYLRMLDGDKVSPIDFNTAKSGFDDWDTKMRQAGKLGNSLTETFKQGAKSFIEWTTASGAVMEVWTAIKQGVGELKDLDDILTEISKTSDLTKNQLKELGDTAFESASKYGKTASDYLTGVQEMYRAGFDNAPEMAELSVLAQSAGDMETNSANDYLLATNAAYKYKGSVEELNKVLDSQNYITNNAAISMQDIADATTETASVAAQYEVQIDELSALIATATANTRESGSEVGTALKAILINLQDTTSAPVTDTFDALGISMTKVVDGAEQLKTPIELIYELADAYNSLPEGDVMRANILNEIGQKRHAKVCVVI